MSLIFTDSCDDGLTNEKWNESAIVLSTTQKRTGYQSIVFQETNNQAQSITFGTGSNATMIVGFGFRKDDTPVALSSPIFTFESGALAANWNVKINTSNQFVIYKGSASTTVLGTATGYTIPNNTWLYLEIKTYMGTSSTTGTIELRINEQSILSLSGIDCQNSLGNTTYTSLTFQEDSAGNQNYWLDDIYVCNGAGTVNNDWLGAIDVECLFPTVEGSTIEFTPSTGTDNSTLARDATTTPPYQTQSKANIEADYNSYSGAAAAKDLYGFDNMEAPANSTSEVKGIVVRSWAGVQTGTRDGRVIMLPSGQSQQNGSTTTLTASAFAWVSQIWETRPWDTSNPFDVADINNAEFGFEALAD